MDQKKRKIDNIHLISGLLSKEKILYNNNVAIEFIMIQPTCKLQVYICKMSTYFNSHF